MTLIRYLLGNDLSGDSKADQQDQVVASNLLLETR